MKFESVYNAKDQFEAQMLKLALEEANIPCYSKESGSGEYIMISAGINEFGEEIVVCDEDVARAKEIIQNALDTAKEVSQETEDIKIPTHKSRGFVARIVIIVIALILLVVLGILAAQNFI